MRRMGEWMYRSTCSSPRHYLEVSVQFRAQRRFILPGKERPEPIGYDVGWVPEQVWKTWRVEKSCPNRDRNSDPSDIQPVASSYRVLVH
jgi:hypothetical protein